MIPSVVGAFQFALAVNRTPELTSPNDKGVLKQPALLKILDERRGGLVNILALKGKVSGQVAMMIPSTMKDLHTANITLDQASGQQTVGGKGAGRLNIRTRRARRWPRTLLRNE